MLFADLVGFTGLTERMDPEQVKRLIDQCFERLVQVVIGFGGRVDKILGDGILALFGAPVAHEDDPERAVRAGLRMQDALAQFVNSSQLVGSGDIRMRIGINSGEVLVGTLAGTDYTAMGDVVNTASRLQSSAPPGGVLVGRSTYALTADTFRYEPFGEMQPRGREQSLTAWLALEPTAPPGRRRRRDVGIVGRHSELTLADAAVELVTRGNRSVLLHVIAENGVGKSRLVDEVVQRLRSNSEISILEGACVPYGEANVWWPIASALSNYLDLDPGASIETTRNTALDKAAEKFPMVSEEDRERMVDVFIHLLGHPSPIDKLEPANARSTIHQAVAFVLEIRSRKGPMVLCVDDIHWADPGLLTLLEHLLNALSRRPFLLITTMRPGSEAVWPPRSDRSTVISLSLQPLTRADTDQLATALLGDSARDEQLLTALYDRSGGNPLFLLELVALTEAGGGGDLPDSLRTLIAARLDQLTPAQRQVVENAAVLGTSGSVYDLERFAAELGQSFSRELVGELDDLGLLEVTGRRWEFSSESVRDAAYQTLTKAARAQRHAGVAKALGDAPGRLEDRVHHTASAAELVQELGGVDRVPIDIADQAMELLTSAADRALDAGSLRMAIRHATRALDLSRTRQTSAADLGHLLLVRARAYTEQRAFADATGDIDALQSVADELHDVTLEAEAHRLRGTLSQMAGRLDEARYELGKAVDLLRGIDRADLLAQALRFRGYVEMFGGSLTDAEWYFGEAHGLYTELGDERGLAYIEQHRAWIAFLSGDLPSARDMLNRSAETHERLGDRNGVGWAFGMLAFVEFFQGRFDEAEALAGIVGAEAEQRGDVWAASMMDTLLADLRLWQGKLDDSAAFADKARQRFKRLGDNFGLILAMAPLVRAQVALGRHAAAERTSEELLAIAEHSQNGTVALMAVAGAAMHRGNGAVAAATAERAQAAMAANGATPYEPSVVAALGYAQQGRVEQALTAIESVPSYGLEHPFTRAVAALIHTVAELPDSAITHADSVATAAGATYLDKVFAYVAAAGAYAQLGNREQAILAAEAAVAGALTVGDVVATALATSTYQLVAGVTHSAHDQRTQLGEGWTKLLSLLTGDQQAVVTG